MAVRFAYWVKGRSYIDVALSPPERLRLAFPNVPGSGAEEWMTHTHPQGGTLFVFPKYDGAAVQLEDFGPPRETFDGMVYYPSKESPDHDWLIRPENARPSGEWIKTYQGELFVAIAFETARRLVLCSGGGMRPGDPVSEFGRLGHEIFDLFFSKDGMPYTDGRLSRFLFLTLREGYWVTEEIAEDLPWLTHQDINPICQTALGCSPKRLADARAGSPSSAQTTPTSP